MAKKISQQLKFCPHCNKTVMCYKNTKEMSWLMHLVLATFTLGFWILIWFILAGFHLMSKPFSESDWVCSQCGQSIYLNRQDPKPLNGNLVLTLKALFLAYLVTALSVSIGSLFMGSFTFLFALIMSIVTFSLTMKRGWKKN